jgi:monoamine oxidase
MSTTRRSFVMSLAATGGYAAAQAALGVLGLAAPAVASTAPLGLPSELGRGRKVVVLGAGIAGLVSAWELRRAGFDVTVVEARERVGGRNWSVRGGTRIEHPDGPQQTAQFDDGLYFNAGPARLPTHHRTILGYAREFGVELEVEVNASRSAYALGASPGSQPVRLRRLQHDARGHIAELLAKSTRQGALDQELSADDRAKLLDFLKVYGDLGADGRYQGSSRAGWATPPGAAAQPGIKQQPLALRALLDPDLWLATVYEESIDQQPTMLQPVGGMDRIPYAFYDRLKDVVRLNTEVKSIRNVARAGSPAGVQVRVRRRDGVTGGGAEETLDADWAISTIPLPVLAGIPNNFAPEVAQAVASVHYDAASKIAWQSRRFWEDEGIYGGLSYVKHDINLLWYPSGGFHRPQGILIGSYATGDNARRFNTRPLAAQFEASREQVERLHPGGGVELQRPVAVAWHKQAWSLGPWVHWERPDAPAYVLLNQPHGRVHFAGDVLAQLGAWQEGAALSAQRAVRAIATELRSQPAAAA